ncbi:MAG: isochorismatase family protein [Planctomycetota bacterium]|jgi:hypothetical protein
MNILRDLYRPSLALLTDLYQLTMAYGYWKSGRAETEAVFQLFFRKHPFQGGYTLVAGLAYVIDLLEAIRFQEEDVEYLRTLSGNNGEALFEEGFLHYLSREARTLLDGAGFPHAAIVASNDLDEYTIDSYSGFFDNGHRKATGLETLLRGRGVDALVLAGLATDYCVKFTALDARELGFETSLILDGIRGVELNPGDCDQALKEMKAAGVNILTLAEWKER